MRYHVIDTVYNGTFDGDMAYAVVLGGTVWAKFRLKNDAYKFCEYQNAELRGASHV